MSQNKCKCPLCEAGVPIKKIYGPYRIEDEETKEELGIWLGQETYQRLSKSLEKFMPLSGKVKIILKKGKNEDQAMPL
jgi:hypothetical protein